VINAQTALNNEQYWQNTALTKNYYASYVIAKDNLDRAQKNYDNAKVGEYINNSNEANAYQHSTTPSKPTTLPNIITALFTAADPTTTGCSPGNS